MVKTQTINLTQIYLDQIEIETKIIITSKIVNNNPISPAFLQIIALSSQIVQFWRLKHWNIWASESDGLGWHQWANLRESAIWRWRNIWRIIIVWWYITAKDKRGVKNKKYPIATINYVKVEQVERVYYNKIIDCHEDIESGGIRVDKKNSISR